MKIIFINSNFRLFTPCSGWGPSQAWLRRISRYSDADWENETKFQGMIGPRTDKGKGKLETTARRLGLGRMELWLTQEDWSGYLVGWQGCMAEDSISFLKAFDAVKIGERDENGKVESYLICSF